MSDFIIEKDVPMPMCDSFRKYPWVIMELGDSFVTPQHQQYSALASANAWGKRNHARDNPTPRKRKFASRRVDDSQARIWRIK